jgi:large subunit ribosomal protein L10
MENPRAEKVAVVDEVRERLSSAGATVLTEYRGLNVSAISQLRRHLREAGGEYKIYKNTLGRFAARDLGLAIEELLTGPTAITFVEGDAAAVAKALRDYARNNPALVVKGGLLGTKPLSSDQIRALADLPSREVLLSQLAGAMAAPMQQFAGLLQALPRNLAYGLKALLDERGGAPMEPAHEPAGTDELDAATTDAARAEVEAPGADAPEAETADAEPAPEPETETPAAEEAVSETEPAVDAAEETPEES